jgi:flagellar L-ring protein precursor FlgH
MFRIHAALLVLAMGLIPGPGAAQSIYADLKPKRATQVGDIVTILISENTSASNKATVKTGKTDALETKTQGFLPIPATKQDFKNTYSGDGSVVRSQQIQARVTATVVGRKDNGDLLIEGARVIEINGEKEVVTVSGSVNPLIIPPENTIEAYRIADLQITYKGKGVATEGSRPGFFLRLVNWIF